MPVDVGDMRPIDDMRAAMRDAASAPDVLRAAVTEGYGHRWHMAFVKEPDADRAALRRFLARR